MAQLIDGRALAKEIQEELKREIAANETRPPCLAVVLVGEHGPSCIYVNKKTSACEAVGIQSIKRHLPANISQDDLLREIEQLNVNPVIDGILVQLPLPPHIDPKVVQQWVDPNKDVDGFHPLNLGKLLIGEQDAFFPCTPLGVKTMLDRTGIDVAGKRLVMVGRSNIVGKPMAAMLMQDTPGYNATVTTVHQKTSHPEEIFREADILIVAIGSPRHIKASMVKEGACVIDIGINTQQAQLGMEQVVM